MKIREFPVMMDYRATVEELIGGGNLAMGWGEEMLISKNFPPIMPKERKLYFLQEKSIFAVTLGEPTNTDKILQNLGAENLMPGNIFDILTLNRTYPASPGIKQKYSLGGLSIVALGSLLKRDEANAYLAPVLECEDRRESPFGKRTIHLNSTEFFDKHKGEVTKMDDWWPEHISFAAVLK